MTKESNNTAELATDGGAAGTDDAAPAALVAPTALVVGATGYVGNALVQHLLARGVNTYAHVRKESKLYETAVKHFEQLGAHVITTPWDLHEMTKMLQVVWPDVIFSCLGTTRARRRTAAPDKKDLENYRSVDYGLTRLLIEANIDSHVRAKVVYLSAMGASRRAKTEYMFVRGELEQYLANSGLRFVVARPGLVTGKDRVESRPLEKVAGRVGDTIFSALGAVGFRKLRDKYTSFTAFELADALAELGLSSEFDGCYVEANELHMLAAEPPEDDDLDAWVDNRP